jgi:hypothetical protein
MQRFCGIDNFSAVRVPGKSTLQNYANWLDKESMTAVLDQLKAAASSRDCVRLRNHSRLFPFHTASTSLEGSLVSSLCRLRVSKRKRRTD